MTGRRWNDLVGAQLNGLGWCGANQQGQPRIRLAVKQFAHQPRTQESGCAGNKNEFFAVQSGHNLSLRAV